MSQLPQDIRRVIGSEIRRSDDPQGDITLVLQLEDGQTLTFLLSRKVARKLSRSLLLEGKLFSKNQC